MSQKFKADELLSKMTEEDRAAYDTLLHDPATTIDDRLEFFLSRGVHISRGAVWKHGRSFQEKLDGIRRSSEIARAFMAVAKEGGAAGLSEASLSRFQQLLMEKLMAMEDEGETDSGELMKLSIALQTAIKASGQIQEIKAEYEKRQKDALAAAEQAAKRGEGSEAVVSKVREILGIAA